MKQQFDCLLPTGLMVTVNLDPAKCTFRDIKGEVWKAAKKLPLYSELKHEDKYGFRGVTENCESVEFDDKDPVKTAHLYQGVLKVFERRGDKSAQKFDMEIGALISKHLSEFENTRDPEISLFRRDILEVAKGAVEKRSQSQAGLELYYFPPTIDDTPLPPHLQSKLHTNNTIHVKVKIMAGANPMEFMLAASIDATAETLLELVLARKARSSNIAAERASEYILKVAGRDEYIHGNYRLSQFAYFRKILASSHEAKAAFTDISVLTLRKRSELRDIISADKPERLRMTLAAQFADLAPQTTGMCYSLWDSKHANDKFTIKIADAFNVTTGKLFGLGVLAQLYLGDVAIHGEVKTRYVPPCETPVWGEHLEFDICLKDLPRNARLCISIHGVWANPLKIGKKKKKNYRNEFPLAWVNISVFDFKRVLRQGPMQLTTWPYADDMDELINPLGTTVQNSGGENKFPVLAVEFATYIHDIKFPDDDRIGNKADGRVETTVLTTEQGRHIQEVESIIHRDPLYELTPADINLLRTYRYYQKHSPDALSKCLRAVDWSTNNAAHDVADMLRLWAPLTPEHALDLLDAGFMDAHIRAHAVKALEDLNDNKLISYLLQLTQVLKYESYLDCDLARFLLRRALENQRVGHFFFWYLRSEMHIPEASVRFGLLLEAYLRGCGNHMQELSKQVIAMDKLAVIGDSIKPKALNKQQKLKLAQDQLANVDLGIIQLPLNPTYRLTAVKCPRVMDSKKLPMWLTFTNADEPSHQINVIFKCGDDLRQDMLTLQLIRIMDQLWQAAGLDLQMHPYGCLSTGDQLGMIEVVMNAQTIAGIQGGMRAALADDPLAKWLQKMNPATDDYENAVESFLLSCAGYCVATYVLGIGDRHNDNIMVTKAGQLFHIDFGHFLGNWKSKLGVKRERVKFILTPDFVYALSKGEGQRSEQFKRFKDVCRDAFLIVRRHANVFINLLNMMLSTGIPELKSHKDVNYLRQTLFLDSTDEAAAESFMTEIDIALKDSWSVRVNWAVHIAAH